MQVGTPKLVHADQISWRLIDQGPPVWLDSRCRSLVTDLKLNQKGILCKGIGIGDYSARAISLVVAKLVIDTDFTPWFQTFNATR
jgi:hypothetical protein